MSVFKNRILFFAFLFFIATSAVTFAQQPISFPFVDVQTRAAENPQEVSLGLQILFLLTVLSLAPSIIIMVTSFVRVSIVLSFVQRALSLQEVPPRQIIMGISLFLTFFIMQPTLLEINEKALRPYLDGKMQVNDFYKGIEKPVRKFMLTSLNTSRGLKNIDTFLYIAKGGSVTEITQGKTIEELASDTTGITTAVLIPSFILSELSIAFEIGIYIFIPFIVIDLIVASALMAMGMIMLPPVMVSLPLKILLFVAVDGWTLLSLQLVQSFK